MKIFVISGKLNGMAKLAGRLQLTDCDFSNVQDVILYDGNDIKVVEISDINRQILEDKYIGIVLVASDKSVLGVGSTSGKIDVQKIMIKYNLIEAKKDITAQKNQKSNVDIYSVKKENFANNTSKIGSNLEKTDCLKQNNDCKKTNQNADYADGCSNDEGVSADVRTDFDLADFVRFGLQDDNLVDKSVAENDVQGFKKPDIGICDFKTDDCGKKQDVFGADMVKNVQTEVVISKDEDIDKGVDFVVEQVKNSPHKKNYYAEIKADLDNFFRSYPKNEELEGKVFGSKWVKITADYDYSVGVIFEDDKPSIIAYAEPYEDKTLVDASKLQLGEWLQIEEKHSKNRGYFIFYQNANTGQMILNTGF